jgi:C2 domain
MINGNGALEHEKKKLWCERRKKKNLGKKKIMFLKKKKGKKASSSSGGDDEPQFALRVVLHAGRDLLACDLSGRSDPYVVVRLGNQSLKTPYQNQTLCPNFQNQNLVLPISAADIHESVRIEVWDFDALTSGMFSFFFFASFFFSEKKMREQTTFVFFLSNLLRSFCSRRR